MKCPSCGNENNEGAAFCSACGTSLNGSESHAAQRQAVPQQPVYQQPAYQMPVQAAPKKKKTGCAIAAGVVAGIAVLLIVVVAIFGTDDSSTDNNPSGSVSQSAQQSDNQTQQGSGTILDYGVEIKDAKMTRNYLGESSIAITYGFTNNSDEAQSFGVAIIGKAYQDGVELQSTVASSSSDIDSMDKYNDIKPGVTTEITVLYKLSNTTSNVEVELTGLVDFSDTKVVKLFTLQ